MTKYSCDIHTEKGWESIALFDERASLAAMTAFALEQYDCGNSLEAPCDAVNVIDMDTGEILWDSYSYFHDVDDFEPADIDSDFGFDPYEGCFTYDC